MFYVCFAYLHFAILKPFYQAATLHQMGSSFPRFRRISMKKHVFTWFFPNKNFKMASSTFPFRKFQLLNYNNYQNRKAETSRTGRNFPNEQKLPVGVVVWTDQIYKYKKYIFSESPGFKEISKNSKF